MPLLIQSPPTNKIRGEGNPFKLHSSGGVIEPQFLGKLRPTSLDTPMEEIQKRYEDDGYVWLKGLLPPSDVWNARKEYFEFLSPTGLIKEDTDPKDGIYCGGDWKRVS
jgi:phytanoyl-CoA hydroxylase